VPRTGFIDHIGIGVPDLAAAKQYYDDLMPILGLTAWFQTTAAGPQLRRASVFVAEGAVTELPLGMTAVEMAALEL
jgi:catechol 2,3-dioxygenase-like lactoylglutathione lyase family enzyme